MRIPLYQVDAFADRPFAGNPAAVCPLEEWLPADRMQAIAAENNLSETAFLVASGEDAFELRWFTPTCEVDLCGHATLASAHVVLNRLRPELQRVRFFTRSGWLTVRRQGELLAMDLPAQRAEPAAAVPDGLAGALGTAPDAVLATRGNLLCVFPAEAAVRGLQPDFARLAAVARAAGGRGVIVTAQADAATPADFVSRYFAPAHGIDEDPVTGSAHCVLVPYWAERLRRSALTALQVSRRGGELRCRELVERVEVAGRVADYLEGTLRL